MAEPEKMNFYADFYRAGLALPEKERQAFYAAVLDYFFTGAEPDLKGAVAGMFELVRGRLDMSARNSESGRKGGSNSIGKRNRSTASSTASIDASSTACDSLGGEGEGEGEGDREKTPSKSEGVFFAREANAGLDPLGEPARGPSYVPPTPEEVAAYVAASGGYPIDAERFVGWYSDHGWPDKGWHGSAMSWSRDARDKRAKEVGERGIPDQYAYLRD